MKKISLSELKQAIIEDQHQQRDHSEVYIAILHQRLEQAKSLNEIRFILNFSLGLDDMEAFMYIVSLTVENHGS